MINFSIHPSLHLSFTSTSIKSTVEVFLFFTTLAVEFLLSLKFVFFHLFSHYWLFSHEVLMNFLWFDTSAHYKFAAMYLCVYCSDKLKHWILVSCWSLSGFYEFFLITAVLYCLVFLFKKKREKILIYSSTAFQWRHTPIPIKTAEKHSLPKKSLSKWAETQI